MFGLWKYGVFAAALAVLIIGPAWYIVRAERLKDQYRELLENQDTNERINDAETSRGDAADDLRWLCERAGFRNCGSGSAGEAD